MNIERNYAAMTPAEFFKSTEGLTGRALRDANDVWEAPKWERFRRDCIESLARELRKHQEACAKFGLEYAGRLVVLLTTRVEGWNGSPDSSCFYALVCQGGEWVLLQDGEVLRAIIPPSQYYPELPDKQRTYPIEYEVRLRAHKKWWEEAREIA